MYSEIVTSPRFYLDMGSFFPEATSFILTGSNLLSLLNFLNSNAAAFIFKKYYSGGGLGESGYRYKKTFIEDLPIPKAVNKYLATNETHDEIDDYVYQAYGFSEQEISYIKALM
jgi:hypothetical protein